MSKLKIYLDVCAYNRPFDSQAQMRIRFETEAKLHIQDCIRDGVYSLCWSYILDYENGKNPYDDKRSVIAPWKKLAADYCSSSEVVFSRGKEIMQKGIKQMDALHIACAIESRCDYFITTDDRLKKKNIEGVKIINPIDFIREMEALK
jgi:predicted nucleic acid-binding protein